ncbi:hypothetical protein LAV_00129 [Sphingobium phage Lacusarx]|uniref:Uncharacterized protein n=1 Tax=Sphingobium phage Lacusarx TaxID=1980139 RepID=A0A1W6DX68_9CAUD|nr:hypothetical protein FDH44_gp174 [Sphingobium phage Lacusarx]ARK07504.1 hypothetical protein LAV_00129 [Sphingobium phage Lacusarx]
MKLYLSNARTWTGTQADAKEAQGGSDFEAIEVPTDKPGLIAWLNEEWAAWYAEMERRAAETAPESAVETVQPITAPEPSPPPPPAPLAAPSGSITERILELQGNDLFLALEAAISRLHETAGPRGWNQFAKRATSWGGGTTAVDRGLGMLVLAGLAQQEESAS